MGVSENCTKNKKADSEEIRSLFNSQAYQSQLLALDLILTLVISLSSATSSFTCAEVGSGTQTFRLLSLPMLTNRGLHCLMISTSSFLSKSSKGSAVIIV